MKLELKHLAGYLPYEVKIYACHNEYVLELEEDCNSEGISVRETIENYHKPILRPLSDLTKEIEVNGEKFVPNNWFGRKGLKLESIQDEKFHIVQKLLQWHFDIYGLIENGLAIDINTI